MVRKYTRSKGKRKGDRDLKSPMQEPVCGQGLHAGMAALERLVVCDDLVGSYIAS